LLLRCLQYIDTVKVLTYSIILNKEDLVRPSPLPIGVDRAPTDQQTHHVARAPPLAITTFVVQYLLALSQYLPPSSIYDSVNEPGKTPGNATRFPTQPCIFYSKRPRGIPCSR
jgi:hypothetical protein